MGLTAVAILGILVVAVLAAWRALDHWADRQQMHHLLAHQPRDHAVFDHAMIMDLPEPAQRFFRFAITEGTPLLPVADIRMQGQFSLGTKAKPNYMKMHARQVLAMPHGFVWKVGMRSGIFGFSGSDSGSWTRFWLGGLIPVARFGGTTDHARSAFGRYVAEAVFWTPAAVLPGPGIMWSPLDDNTARLSVDHNGMTQDVDLRVAQGGQPLGVVFQRWSNANPDKVHQPQPFGGVLSDFRDFEGYRLPTHVEAGNFFGTDDYYPFFVADITRVTYPRSAD